MGAGAVHCVELRLGRRCQVEIQEEERQGDVAGGNELRLTGECLGDGWESTVVLTIAKIRGVLLADLDTDAIDLRWVYACSKEQKL